jgi:hypothetical protein
MVAGAMLARRTETVLCSANRGPLRGFATSIDEQTRRLETAL